MKVSALTVAENNPMLAGTLAAHKQFFGDHGRFAVAPIHTRFDAVEWFVWDAEKTDNEGLAEVVRQAETIEAAMDGLAVA